MGAFIDLSGKHYGLWKVLSRGANTKTRTMWECRCLCGTVRLVQAGHLTSGASISCGCAPRPANKHGQARKPFTKKYKTWRYIKARCCNPNHKNANVYSGLLCKRWLDFAAFDADVPDPESDTLTIDRINNTKGYKPGNIRWVAMAEQHRNQSNCRWITFAGRTQLLTDWAREIGIATSTLHERIKKWGLPKALSR